MMFDRKTRISTVAFSLLFSAMAFRIKMSHAFLTSVTDSKSIQLRQILKLQGTRSRFFANQNSDNFLDQILEELEGKENEIKDTSKLDVGLEREGWRFIDWKALYQQWRELPSSTTARRNPSPVESRLVRNRLVYFKRDDQIRLRDGAPISGNKARKMVALNDLETKDFPSCVVSFGGPQSNAMLALAAIVHFQNQKALSELKSSDNPQVNVTTNDVPLKRFVYYTKKLPRFLRNQPNGNLFRAQALGMEIVEVSPEEYKNLFGGEWGGPTEPPSIPPPVPGDSLWIPQGGACGLALRGASELADEIVTFWTQNGQGRPLSVCIPGGTCSTAALVNCAIQDILRHEENSSLDIRVVVIPCVGDENYARRQMLSVASNFCRDASLDTIPIVLPPAPDRPQYFGQARSSDSYFAFGEPDVEILYIFQEMKEEIGVVLDLIYGAPSWTLLLRHFRTDRLKADSKNDRLPFDPGAPIAGREIMYVHTGGLEAINSQMMRYQYKGLIDLGEVQLPGRDY